MLLSITKSGSLSMVISHFKPQCIVFHYVTSGQSDFVIQLQYGSGDVMKYKGLQGGGALWVKATIDCGSHRLVKVRG